MIDMRFEGVAMCILAVVFNLLVVMTGMEEVVGGELVVGKLRSCDWRQFLER